MNECLKYVRWHGRRRLYSARVPLVLWLVTDLVVLVHPQSICTRIAGSSNLNFLILLFNMIFFLAGACLFFYLLFGRRGLKLPAWLAAAAVYSFTGNLWMFFPISTEWQAALFAALLRLLLCILLIPACARIVRKRGY